MSALQSLVQHLALQTGHSLQNHRLTSVSGGDINSAHKLQTAEFSWFIKLNRADLAAMFAAEATGLQELAASKTFRVPEVICVGDFQRHAYLVLNFIDLQSLQGPSARQFGTQLARLHRQPKAYFGWPIDNTIGSTPQYNQRDNDWVHFWQHHRLHASIQSAR